MSHLCKNILIVEDDPAIREEVELCLRDEGYRVVAVGEGRDGLRLLSKLKGPTLVLLDMMMPRMNGWEFSEACRTREGQDPAFKIVVISALEAGRALSCGPFQVDASAYLRKPFKLEKLLEIVGIYCEPALSSPGGELLSTPAGPETPLPQAARI